MTIQGNWFTYSRIDNFGYYPDPVGNYPKPDSNIMVPSGTPITALASGTVTGVRAQPWGPLADSITIKMDTPWNEIATHTAYNYVNSPQVHIGQHIQAGQTIAYAGNPYGIGTAFAFTDANVYGNSTVNEPFSGTYINPLLNPVPFLNQINSGGGAGYFTSQLGANFLTNDNSNGNSGSNSNILGIDYNKFIDATLLFIIGLTLLIVGGMLVINRGISFPNMNSQGNPSNTSTNVANKVSTAKKVAETVAIE